MLLDADAVLIDLSSRRADPIAAIAAARAGGRPVAAVGPHEDLADRKRALAAGAARVYAYSKLFGDGPRTIAAWLGLPEPAGTNRPEMSPADTIAADGTAPVG